MTGRSIGYVRVVLDTERQQEASTLAAADFLLPDQIDSRFCQSAFPDHLPTA
jgi:hypothetical protein